MILDSILELMEQNLLFVVGFLWFFFALFLIGFLSSCGYTVRVLGVFWRPDPSQTCKHFLTPSVGCFFAYLF